jgi:hypothetical protein
MAEILEGGKRDNVNTAQFAVTNITEDLALDCNGEAGCLALADVVGTLIRELIRKGIIHGTVA